MLENVHGAAAGGLTLPNGNIEKKTVLLKTNKQNPTKYKQQ